ncbi:MAG: hypothetical protein HS113_25135 [Verrucomicrobiales bacterium]|nr:hypothetical protein [Verrucomicrobiales bacterium]
MKIPPVSLAALAALAVGLGVLVTRSQSPAAPDAPPTPAEAPGTDPATGEPVADPPANTPPAPITPATPAFPVPPVPSSTRTPVRPPAATPRAAPTGAPATLPSLPAPGTVGPRTAPTASPAAQPAFPVPPPARLPASPAAQPAVPGFPPAGVPAAAGAAAAPPAGISPPVASAAAGGTGAAVAGADGLIAPGMLALQMAELEQVLAMYAELTQRTVLRTTALPKANVMLSNQTPWTTEEAVQALDTVLAMNGISMLNVGEKFVSAVPSNTVLQEGGAFSGLDPKDLSETGQFVTKVVKVKHALPSELQQIIAGFSKTQNGILPIDSTMTLVLRDYPANVKRMTEILDEVDVEVERDYKLEVIPIKYGKVDEIYGTMSALIGGSGAGVGTGAGAVARTTGVGRTTSRAMRGGTGYGSRTGGSGVGGYSSGGYRNPMGGGGYYPQQAVAAPVGTAARPATPSPATTFNQRFQSILNRAAGQQAQQLQLLEDARIVPDERSNSLIVYASKDDMKMITNIVAKVDRLLAQVVIDAIIMDVALTDAYQLGVSWLMNPQQSGNWTSVAASRQGQNLVAGLTNIASGGGGFSYLARFKDDLTVAVEALASNNKGQILSRPRVQTSHAMPAVFSVGQSVPYVTTTSYGGSYYGPQSSFQQLDVSTELNVTPFITPDGLVVMEIDQNIEEISGFEEFPNVGKLPRTVHRYASATVSVRDRETIILGGYIRTSKSKTSSGVPLLKDIPILGAAFRSKGSDSSRSELIVLIRPTVLITPEDAAAEAEAERNRLPGIREMERSVDEYEENTGARLKTLFGK